MKKLAPVSFALAIASAAVPSAKAQEVSLMFATATPATAALTNVFFKQWAERVNAKGRGAVRIDIRDGIAISNTVQMYSRVLEDIAQVGWTCTPLVAGKFPRSDVLGLPLTVKNSEVGAVAMHRLYKSGLLDAEFDQVQPLVLTVTPPSGLHFARPPATLDNLNGLKIGASTRMQTRTVALLGGTPISISLLESYEALQRRTIDGFATGWTGIPWFKLNEVLSYHVETELNSIPCMVFMAKKRYEALPARAKEVLAESFTEAESRGFGVFWDSETAVGRRATENSPGTRVVVRPTEAQLKGYRERLAPLTAEWAAVAPDSEKILASVRATLAEVDK